MYPLYTAVHSQTAVTAHFLCKQLLHFALTEQYLCSGPIKSGLTMCNVRRLGVLCLLHCLHYNP